MLGWRENELVYFLDFVRVFCVRKKIMGRHRKIQLEKPHLPETTVSSMEKTELSRERTKQAFEQMELNSENTNTSSQQVAQNIPSDSTSSRKMVKKYSPYVRRSERIQQALPSSQSGLIDPVIEEIALSESEREEDDEAPPAHQEVNFPDPSLDGMNLEGKVDFLTQLLEAQKKNLKDIKKLLSREGKPSGQDGTFKSLYMNSLENIETLRNENYQLALKLQNTLGKLEVYENGGQDSSKMLEKLKDVILASNLSKVSEAAVNASAQAIRDALSPTPSANPSSAAKRSRLSSF